MAADSAADVATAVAVDRTEQTCAEEEKTKLAWPLPCWVTGTRSSAGMILASAGVANSL